MSDKIGKSRRRRRSEETRQAMTYQLEYVVDELDMEMMLLADNQGIILAHTGDEDTAELLAAHAEGLARGMAPTSDLLRVFPDLTRNQILCEAVNLDDIPLYLCAIMDPSPENAKGYQRVRDGIQRIYYSTSELAGDPGE